MKENITVDGIEYTRSKLNGNRAVVVVDRGWLFAGDVIRKDGRIYLSRAVWIFGWKSVGFSTVIEDPSQADIRPISDVDIPDGAEIFTIPVPEQWGLK